MKPCKWLSILLLLFFTLHPFLAAQAQDKPAILKALSAEDKDKGPITIESDQASFDKKAGVMIYSGHVVVRRGKMVISSEELKGFLDEEQKQLSRMVAEGGVRVVKEDKTLEAQKATYYRNPGEEERLELEGKPVIHLKENSINADKMVYNLIHDKFEAEGHVKAVFHQHNAELSAQKLVVFLEKGLSTIKKIVASDQVVITQKDREISADQGTFFGNANKIVLTGNPVSRQGENTLSGRQIVYYMDSETVEVKKAKTILHPKSEGGATLFSPAR